jgi:biotin operon repressor
MPKKWTAEDEAYLVANYNKVPIQELAKQFGVSKKAVRVKYGKLRNRSDFLQLAQKAPDEPPPPTPTTQPRGPRKWSEDDERYLLANYNTMSLDELARHFGVTKKAVRVKYGKIKHKAAELVPDQSVSEAEQLQVGPRKWTEEDESFLLQHYEDLGPDAMAEHFGISRSQVQQKYTAVKEKRRPTLHIPRMHGEAPKKSLVQQVRRRKPTTPLVSMSLSSAIQRSADQQAVGDEGSVPTHIQVMTEDGWKPLEMSKQRISRS